MIPPVGEPDVSLSLRYSSSTLLSAHPAAVAPKIVPWREKDAQRKIDAQSNAILFEGKKRVPKPANNIRPLIPGGVLLLDRLSITSRDSTSVSRLECMLRLQLLAWALRGLRGLTILRAISAGYTKSIK
jgi:hypothetical protein